MKGEFKPHEIPPSGKLKFSMSDLPDDWHDRIFKKDKPVESVKAEPLDGGWVSEQTDNQSAK